MAGAGTSGSYPTIGRLMSSRQVVYHRGMPSRRDFLITSAGGLAVGAVLTGCAKPTGGSVAAPSPPRAPHAELEELPLHALSEQLDSKATSSVALLEAYRARIEALDRSGPTLRSVLELNPDAPALAAQLDAERRAGKTRGPLHGVPILLKDNIDTGDRMLTSAGSLALDTPAPGDAFLVERLRAAGALILGKANLSEWANIRSLRSTSGWSGRGGLTRHPYALDRNPSGSSSGSAVAVAASLCAAAVGTETDGSIISPSSVCGLVGLKPTVGLVSRRGVVPISHSQDTAGPMARTVRDAALLLRGMIGVDARDPATAAQPDLGAQLAAPLSADLRGKKIGVVRTWPALSARVLERFAAAVEVLKSRGADVTELELPPQEGLGDAELKVLLCELKADLAAYLATRGAKVRSLADVIAFNQAHADRELTWFGQDAFEKAEASVALDHAEYLEARKSCLRLARDVALDPLLARVDALCWPSNGPAWLTDPINGDSYTGGDTSLPAIAGYPSITVPASELSGLPLGLMFVGRPWSEKLLLDLAFGFEQATSARRPPTYKTTALLPSE
jgi:amidase